jgi:poly(A) polymerase
LYFYRGKKMRIIEVTTFRADGDEVISDENSGRILQDNLFGSASDDAVRRDFTCNALFYEPTTENIIDYTGGYDDIRRGRLRLIGAPAIRFRQDPVRLLRALRLGVKLNLTISQATQKTFALYAPLLTAITTSRLFDEFAKIINSGASANIIQRCAECGITDHILPAVSSGGDFFMNALKKADLRHQSGKDISLSFIIAALFWMPVRCRWLALQQEGMLSVAAMEQALEAANFPANNIVPRRVVARAVDLYFLVARFVGKVTLRRTRGVLRNPLFDRAIAFGTLCGGDIEPEVVQWWSDYQLAGDDERKTMIATKNPGTPNR